MKYKFDKPAKSYSLKKSFKEISGINFTPDQQHLAFVHDEAIQIFLLNLKTEEITESKNFNDLDPDENDSEDIVIIEDTAYILTAGKKPQIYKIKNYEEQTATVTIHNLKMDHKLDPEGLCHDQANNRLLIACKAALKKKDRKREIYSFDLEKEERSKKPVLIIDAKDFLKKDKFFYPSAIAIHPITGDIYLIGSQKGKRIVCYDSDGNFKDSQKLDKEIFPQPEGLTFSKSGDLYISTEAKGKKKAKIFYFKS